MSGEHPQHRQQPPQRQRHAEPVYRTSPARVAKMMAIMLGICVVGGAIFFGMWDYWISELAPVATAGAGRPAAPAAPPPASGETIEVPLSFVESSDILTLGFNALPGEEGSNPTISASVGDEIVFDVVNDGITLHAFGVTQEEEGISGVIPGTEVASMQDPLLAGESGTATFVPAEAGEYYYICTVPGHRQQGMVGKIVVGEAPGRDGGAAAGGGGGGGEAAAPTGVSHEFSLDFVESEDFTTYGFNALPGEEGSNPEITVASGDTVTFTTTNTGKTFHSFGITASPEDFAGSLWGSEIGSMAKPLKGGEPGSVTFTAGAPGRYHYICTVPGHALQGMAGSFVVG